MRIDRTRRVLRGPRRVLRGVATQARYPRARIALSARIARSVKIRVGGGRVQIGAATVIGDGVYIETYGGRIEIGERCAIGPYAVLYGHGGLHLGNDVLIAAHTVIVPSAHRFDRRDIPIRAQGETQQGVSIGDGAWLGAHAVVLDDVTVGEGAIVAAGAVVNRDVAPYEIVGGVPARVIKRRPEAMTDREQSRVL